MTYSALAADAGAPEGAAWGLGVGALGWVARLWAV